MRSALGLKPSKPNLEVKMNSTKTGNRLEVISTGEIFGPQPFLAIKTKEGKYYWENFDFLDENVWSFTFDTEHASLDLIDSIGVAANSPYGTTQVIKLDIGKGNTKTHFYNE